MTQDDVALAIYRATAVLALLLSLLILRLNAIVTAQYARYGSPVAALVAIAVSVAALAFLAHSFRSELRELYVDLGDRVGGR